MIGVRPAENAPVMLALTGLVVWFVLAAVVAVGLGRGIRLADQRAQADVLPAADLPAGFAPVA